MPEQLEFTRILACLDFPGRRVVTVHEIAEALGFTPRHVAGWIESGDLLSVDGKGNGSSRSRHRVPIDSYRDFIVRRLTDPEHRREFLLQLPKGSLRALRAEIDDLLKTAA
ncbi:hypothetical protein [Actomonas aquatica]|uniref:HTH merR-type domain-containing protein n=1 Tax=Actomonas aquatica TaxID=2866162 RepID=A0ABZ1CGI9_9BACT|nr:hypothetical protein [Opitutus sp. WL0086]WRQ89385.1 hypothetical protein K1X11_008185 [Opitutus sp. WL0086]